MKPFEFYNMTYREYLLMQIGYQNRRSRDFEHTRLICYTMASAFRGDKKLPSIQRFMPLPTDEGEVKMEAEELNEMRARLVNYYNTVFGKNLA